MKHREKENLSVITRRDFLKGAGIVATGAAIAGPTIVSSTIFSANAPSNRITIGCIGVGGMGMTNLRWFMSNPGSEVVAVCDVDADHRERARLAAELNPKSSYNDFRHLLPRDDIDAVVVTTPDHWHVPISIAAAKAGKDIYCEKPLSLTIAGGRALSDTVRRYGRILQTGSQQRSDRRFRFACELSYKHALELIKRNSGEIGDKKITIKLQKPKPVKTEVCFEGHWPIEKRRLNITLKDTDSFEFEGIGFSAEGGTRKTGKEDYTLLVDVVIDGKLSRTMKLPTNNHDRSYTPFWQYKLPEGKHKVELKVKNQTDKAYVRIDNLTIYGPKASCCKKNK